MSEAATTARARTRDLDAPPELESTPPADVKRQRLVGIARIIAFDAVGPLIVYNAFKSQGTVLALVLSGIPPAVGVLWTMIEHRRVEAVGVLVLLGVAVGAILGAVSDNPRVVLLEGSVPTAIFACVCLGSLWARRPLMFSFAYSFMGGAGSPEAEAFDGNWKHEGFRHYFRKLTLIWGVAYLVEAAMRVVIVESFSTGEALAISKIAPYVVLVPLIVYNIASGKRARAQGEARERAEAAALA